MSLIDYIIYQDTKTNGYGRMIVYAELAHYNHLLYQMGFPIGSPIASAFNRYNYIKSEIIMRLIKTEIANKVFPSCKCGRDSGSLQKEIFSFD